MTKEEQELLAAKNKLEAAYVRLDNARNEFTAANTAVQVAEKREQEARFKLRALATTVREDQ